MRLTINGEERNFDQQLDVASLLAALEVESRRVAVERNLEIVPKSLYPETELKDGDRIEIVQFVGGG